MDGAIHARMLTLMQLKRSLDDPEKMENARKNFLENEVRAKNDTEQRGKRVTGSSDSLESTLFSCERLGMAQYLRGSGPSCCCLRS